MHKYVLTPGRARRGLSWIPRPAEPRARPDHASAARSHADQGPPVGRALRASRRRCWTFRATAGHQDSRGVIVLLAPTEGLLALDGADKRDDSARSAAFQDREDLLPPVAIEL